MSLEEDCHTDILVSALRGLRTHPDSDLQKLWNKENVDGCQPAYEDSLHHQWGTNTHPWLLSPADPIPVGSQVQVDLPESLVVVVSSPLLWPWLQLRSLSRVPAPSLTASWPWLGGGQAHPPN